MIIEEGLVAYLTAYAGLSSLIGTRISPLRLPENVTYPALTYQRISSQRVQSQSGSSKLAFPRFQFDCYAKTYLAAKNVSAQLRAALDGFKGTMGDVPVGSSLSQSDRDFYDPNTRIWRVSIDFVIGHEE